MEPRDWLVTLVACTLIYFGYRVMLADILFHHEGVDVEGRIVAKETRDTYAALRLRYSYKGRDYEQGFQLADRDRYNQGDRVLVRILKDRPEVYTLDLSKKNVERNIEIVLMLAIVYAAYRTTATMIAAVAPNK